MTQFPRNHELDLVRPGADGHFSSTAAPAGHEPASRRNPFQVIWLRRWIVLATTVLSLGIGVALIVTWFIFAGGGLKP